MSLEYKVVRSVPLGERLYAFLTDEETYGWDLVTIYKESSLDVLVFKRPKPVVIDADELREAAEDLARVLRDMDEAIGPLLIHAHKAGRPYRGPKFGKELRRLEEALTSGDEATDHAYAETLLDRDDQPISPTCAHCGRLKKDCLASKIRPDG